MLTKITAIKFILIISFTLLASCGGPSMNAHAVYNDCSYKFDNIVKVDQCAKNMMRSFASQYGSGSIYGRGTPELQFYQGLVYKVKSNQISNSEALNRYANYKQQAEQKRKSDARKVGEAADGLNCIFFGVAC